MAARLPPARGRVFGDPATLPSPVAGTIDRLDNDGAGVAVLAGGHSLHVAGTLPGEIAMVRQVQAPGRRQRGDLLALIRPGADRVTPPCRHFGTCGGCSLQHFDDAAYAAWKCRLVADALERAGFRDPALAALVRTPPRARRRMDLAVSRVDGGVVLGLHRAGGEDVVDVRQCEVLHPSLFALIEPLRPILSSLAALRRRGSVIANLLANGPDLLLRTDGPLAPTDRAKLANFARSHAVPRVAWAQGAGPGETAAQLGEPYAMFAGIRVEPPPGAFLQACEAGEAAMIAAVLDGLPAKLTGKSFAVELFAGCGTISFALAERLRVVAFEGDAAAAACVRRAGFARRVEMTRRDLARQPLSVKEFTGAAAIVLDPPFAGAAPQMPAIAGSGIKRVIYVSCNPAALARDAATLAAAGYRLLRAVPIDQFLWSAHVECVAVFELA